MSKMINPEEVEILYSGYNIESYAIEYETKVRTAIRHIINQDQFHLEEILLLTLFSPHDIDVKDHIEWLNDFHSKEAIKWLLIHRIKQRTNR